MKKTVLILFILISSLFAEDMKVLKIHCGTTMKKPIKMMAQIFEKEHNCKVKVKTGGSQDLYDSLKFLKNIDLYLPGSPAYLKKYKKDEFFKNSVYIGYNKAAIFVLKGNPKNITDLDSLLDKDVKTILCDPDSGSIGKNSKKVLVKYKGKKFYEKAYDRTKLLATDSKDINHALEDGEVDMAINWRATYFFCKMQKYVDIIDIDERFAPKKKLMLTLLSFSKEPDLAKEFMTFASSDKGKAIMKEYGFL
jgi:molybdate transport system substrate-binding protein